MYKSESLRGDSDRVISCVSACLIALLVFATVVVFTLVAYNSVVILAIAETNSGQRDFIFQPKSTFINCTRINEVSSFSAMPRVLANFVLNQKQKGTGVFLDFALEKQHHLGTLNDVIGPSIQKFVYVHRSLGYTVGEKIEIAFESNQLLKAVLETVINQTAEANIQGSIQVINHIMTFIENNNTLSALFQVKQVLDSAMGKISSSSVDGTFFLDINHAFEHMFVQTFQQLNKSQFFSLLRTFKLTNIATEVTVNIPNRISVYSNPNTEEVISFIRQFGQKIAQQIGFFAINIEMPIVQQLQILQNFGMFVGLMLKSVIVSLFILSTIMLHNTILLGVQQQKYNLSILKLLGADRKFVAYKILRQSLKTVLAANVIAYPLVFVAFQAIELLIKESIGYHVSVGLTLHSFIVGISIGFLVPVCASIFPILTILNNDLAKDLSHRPKHQSETKTQIYVEGSQFPWRKVVFGVISSFYGLSIYYFLPYGMINQNLGLLVIIFFVLLEGLLVGLVILSYSFDFVLQTFLAKLILCCVDALDRALTLKNLSIHRIQNRHTSLIYALSVSLIIMVSVGFNLQIDIIKQDYLSYMGADIDIGGKNVNPLLINQILSSLPNIKMYTYSTLQLDQYLRLKGVQKVLISDKAKLFFLQDHIIGVAGKFVKKPVTKQLDYSDAQNMNIYEYLNTQKGDNTCIIGEYSAKKMGILNSKNHQFYINIYYQNQVRRVAINYSTIARKRVGLYYNSFIVPNSQVGVSIQTYKQLANINSNEDLIMTRAKIYLQDLGNIEQIAKIIKQRILENKQYKYNISFIWNRYETDKTFANIKFILNSIMLSLLIIVLILCLFSLVTTTYINARNQQKQIGILLTLGYSRTKIQKVFIYESFVMVINSCGKGIVCGYIVAFMMTLQNDLFSSSNINLSFDLTSVIIIVVIAAASSVISAKKSLQDILKKQASQMMNVFH